MLGFADDFISGAAKGVGDGHIIRNNVNNLESNMTVGQIKKLNKAVNNTGSAAKNIARQNAYSKSTKAVTGLKGIKPTPSMGARLGDAMGAGYREAYQGAKTGGVKGATSAFKKAHLNADGSLNKGRVAGTFATTSLAARVATGGGLYKDRNGNNNIAGLPFI
jgi:hypothetical protein